MRTIHLAVACVAMLVATAGHVQAGMISYSGDTTGSPTWNRPVLSGPGLSGLGTATPFNVTSFSVTMAGSYNFLSMATLPVGWDNYLHLYQTNFNPVDQLTNLIVGNDDFPNIGQSGFNSISLSTGTNYFLVTSGFDNSDFGTFTNTISGPGDINLSTAVPEPSSLAVFGIGACVVGVGAARRRRREMQQETTA